MAARDWLLLLGVAAVGLGLYFVWQQTRPDALPEGFAKSNGRIEAVEIDIATKSPGRLLAVMVNEGDLVTAGQVLAHMDVESLRAQLREAEAELRRAQAAVETARSIVAQKTSEKRATESVVSQREAEHDLASRNFARGEQLVGRGVLSTEEHDTQRAALFGAKAAVDRAKADVAAAQAAILTAQSQVIQAEASVGAAQAKIDRLQVEIDDGELKSPRDGRIQYRIAQPGEVLSAGGKVLNMIDLTDVYMTFFLPTAAAGRVRMGAEVRLVFDAAPQYVIPARASFVSDTAQFTPKTVETAEEREKLMFRVKAHLAPDLLRKYMHRVKTGVPGMAYVQLDPQMPWPETLQERLPE